jgi:rhodanese-related sulfurtransferase
MDWRDVPRIVAREVRRRIDAGEPLTIVDVRRPAARRGGYIAGDVSYPMSRRGEHEPLPRDRTLVLY